MTSSARPVDGRTDPELVLIAAMTAALASTRRMFTVTVLDTEATRESVLWCARQAFSRLHVDGRVLLTSPHVGVLEVRLLDLGSAPPPDPPGQPRLPEPVSTALVCDDDEPSS